MEHIQPLFYLLKLKDMSMIHWVWVEEQITKQHTLYSAFYFKSTNIETLCSLGERKEHTLKY